MKSMLFIWFDCFPFFSRVNINKSGSVWETTAVNHTLSKLWEMVDYSKRKLHSVPNERHRFHGKLLESRISHRFNITWIISKIFVCWKNEKLKLRGLSKTPWRVYQSADDALFIRCRCPIGHVVLQLDWYNILCTRFLVSTQSIKSFAQ